MRRSIPWPLLIAVLQFGPLTSCARGRDATAPSEPSPSTIPAFDLRRGEFENTSVTVVDVPGGTLQTALDVNDRGIIVGRYLAADGKTTYGYVRSTDGEFTTVQYPNAVFTVAAGTNDRGDIVGQYSLPSDFVPGKPAVRHGYLLRDGVYTTFDPPGSIRTNALGINNEGDIVGRYNTAASTKQSGFVLRGGSFIAPIAAPGATETNLWAINSRGDIVGAYVSPDGSNHLFVFRDGSFEAVNLPVGNVPTDKGDINDRGEIAGFFCDAPSPAPCASGIGLTGVHAFAYSHGVFRQFDVPGARATVFFGVNARGTLVGNYQDANNAYHGFSLQRERHDHNEPSLARPNVPQ